ncbi:Hypothetical Protein SiL_0909 [Sulfolobus islandicus LAL14/1]|uniref:Uncharacterized protein n=1 Tax=Saccharolobus islandicus LAL14/1 TaxID=1241935 RepID=M9U8B8_SACIS|nr:Hypothetical Protein SiL_0909 [Sulfolobus islandicus LAL14/1]
MWGNPSTSSKFLYYYFLFYDIQTNKNFVELLPHVLRKILRDAFNCLCRVNPHFSYLKVLPTFRLKI